jgi:acetylornithine/succinyldiaminopimelate/putrescine aminotransferase
MNARALLKQGYADFAAYVNPLIASRAALTGEPVHIERVENGRLVCGDGKVADDFLSGWGTQALGHRNDAIGSALSQFLETDAPLFFTSGVTPFAGKLARVLSERTAGAYDSAFFASGGTEAIEAAMKLARAATGRKRILCFEGAYHGCTFGSVAMMHKGPYRDAFGPHLPEVEALPWNDSAALEAALAKGDVAAVVAEPIQIEGGVRALTDASVEALCRLTEAHGALLVADEIQTGLGRTGRFLVSEAWPRRPDVLALGKALGGGYVPISAMLTKRAHMQRAYSGFESVESHASTFSGNGLGPVAALAFLDTLTPEVIAQAKHRGEVFQAALRREIAHSQLVTELRGEGMLLGIEMKASEHPWLTFEYLGIHELGKKSAVGLLLCHQLYKAGFITNVCGHDWNVVRIQPPLNTEEARLLAFVQATKVALDYLEALT